MARLYERFLRVLQNWPLNLGPEYPLPIRYLPDHLRKQGKIAFSARGDFTGDTQQCEKRLTSLERLTKNHWSKAYPRTSEKGALGLNAELCKFGLTEEYQKLLETSRLGLFFRDKISSFRKGQGKA